MSYNPTARAFYKICEKIEVGTLHFVSPQGDKITFGVGMPYAYLEIHSWKVISAVLKRGDIGLGETYSEGLWDSHGIEALVLFALANRSVIDKLEKGSPFYRLFYLMNNYVFRRNSKLGSKRNIKAHYDVGNDFYRLWLDESMTYSSAMYKSGDTLETAQERKYDRLLNMVKPSSGGHILEIGCGWGGFAQHATDAGCDLKAVTISSEQHNYAAKRLGGRAQIDLLDYREIEGKYDAIVSIEMIEAVGLKYWPDYFKTLKSRLNPGGKIALQAIIIENDNFDDYKTKSDYIRQYTFPGGMLISPDRIESNARNAGLKLDNIHRFGEDYAKTLREWYGRFMKSETQIRALGYDDAFVRSWQYYLQICAAAFQHGQHCNVTHLELSHA